MDKIEPLLLSNELDEMIGKPPKWIIRWGITVLGTIVALIFFLSYIIKYPETITIPCHILPDNPSIGISVNGAGQIKKFNISDGSFVHKNDVLFYWKDDGGEYLSVKAPVTGVVEFISSTTMETKASQNQVLFYIRSEKTIFYAGFYADPNDVRKLRLGQKLTIGITNYPVSLFGNLVGKITNINTVKTEKGYYVRVELFNGLKTVKNKVIPFKNGIEGNIEIIVAKKRLINKIIEKLF